MGSKEAIFIIVAIIVGGGLGYFWSTTRPQDSIEIVAGLSLLTIGLVYFSLHSMSKQ